jgi:hypothetical protein
LKNYDYASRYVTFQLYLTKEKSNIDDQQNYQLQLKRIRREERIRKIEKSNDGVASINGSSPKRS